MQDRKVFLYYFLSIGMVLFPILNLLSFVPMVILYKKSNFRTYIFSAIMFFVFSLFVLGNFTSLIPIFISFIMIKGLDSTKEGYVILLGSTLAMTILIVSDFMLLKLNANSYEMFLKVMTEFLESYPNYKEALNIESVEVFVNRMMTIYPSVSFGISFIFCALGYSFLSKRIYKLNRDSDDFITPFDSKFAFVSILILAVMIFVNMNGVEKFYEVYLICLNLFISFISIMIVQGFIKFNALLIEKTNKIVGNILSFISIFFAIIYTVYFIYGIYSSIKRGVKWERK